MLRRKPTRLELKLDDIDEFESVRKELEVMLRPDILPCRPKCSASWVVSDICM